MQAFRFLLNDGRDPIANIVWSTEWSAPALGVVACRVEHLHHWIAPELWRIDLGGAIVEREVSLLAERGRLIARVEGWDETACRDFLRSCIDRHPTVSCDPNDTRWNAACDAGYDASQTAGMEAAANGLSFAEAEAAERALQLSWVTARAGLDGAYVNSTAS